MWTKNSINVCRLAACKQIFFFIFFFFFLITCFLLLSHHFGCSHSFNSFDDAHSHNRNLLFCTMRAANGVATSEMTQFHYSHPHCITSNIKYSFVVLFFIFFARLLATVIVHCFFFIFTICSVPLYFNSMCTCIWLAL